MAEVVTLPCACGGTVTADPDDPRLGVRSHNRSDRHRRWSARAEAAPVLGPMPCTACRRMLVWMGAGAGMVDAVSREPHACQEAATWAS